MIFATTATLIEQFRSGDWSPMAIFVETVQIDEASQTPWFVLLSLAVTFPTATFGLIGDHQQLPPHSHTELPQLCRDLAIGNLLERAAGEHLMPSVNLTMVFRCPAETTLLISALAYDNTLLSQRLSERPHRHVETLELSSGFPIQVLDLPSVSASSGTSQINIKEAQRVAAMVKKITRMERNQVEKTTIGVLCYYKAQAGLVGTLLEDENIFINTVNASQGQEFDVVFVLTSFTGPFNVSPFLADQSRLVVAATRAKHFCLIFARREAAVTTEIWNDFFELLPEEAVNQVEKPEH